jgi:hypothetical protein
VILKYTEIEQAFREVQEVSRIEFAGDEILVILSVQKIGRALVDRLCSIEKVLRDTDPNLPMVYIMYVEPS